MHISHGAWEMWVRGPGGANVTSANITPDVATGKPDGLTSEGNYLWKFTFYTNHLAVTFIFEPNFSTLVPGTACYGIKVSSLI